MDEALSISNLRIKRCSEVEIKERTTAGRRGNNEETRRDRKMEKEAREEK